MRVMVVDDEAAVRDIEARVLTLAGYDVLTASDGPAALSLFDDGTRVDLVIADLKMPEMNGDEMARRLCDRRPDLKVLFVTGHADHLFGTRRALGDGQAYLDKPFTPAGLLEAVSVLLSGHIRQTATA
jgi:two-component system, cell cycle sensor histidine kinase and response regulator CckA